MPITPATMATYAEIETEGERDPDFLEAPIEITIKAASLPKGLRLRVSEEESVSDEGRDLIEEGILEIS
jgi:hypothetical protein